MKTLNFTNSEKLYFTSDLHLGHQGILTHSNRPFTDTNEMDKSIIKNWNDVISNDDIVFILGDFCWKMGSSQIKHYISRFKGNKILILGNHDKGKYPDLTVYDGFVNIKVTDPDGVDGYEKGYQRLTLCHYPMLSWYQSHRGAWQLFGHIHSGRNSTSMDYIRLRDKLGSQLDVGVDAHDYTPISYNEVKKLINFDKEIKLKRETL